MPQQQGSANAFTNLLLILPPLLSIGFGFLLYAMGLAPSAAITAGVTLLCAVWWTTEAIPIPVTSLLPLSLFPLLGVLSPTDVAAAYGSPLILLLLGGFLLSTAMEHTNAHKNIALTLVNVFGGRNEKHVVFGFMASAAILSMWISNTATTLMLLPIALALLDSSRSKSLAIPLLLGICYSASVGGIGTPIGTPPNLIMMKVYNDTTGTELTFVAWMKWGVPLVILFIPVIGFWLTRKMTSSSAISLPKPDTWTTAQKRVLWVFGITALLWITRKAPFGGWAGNLDLVYANDAAVALLAVVALFLIPAGTTTASAPKIHTALLTWESANKIPWGILLLFSGGICIAKAFNASGLATLIADNIGGLGVLTPILMILLICLCVTFLTEVTSNTATTSLLMPILAVASGSTGIDPMMLMLPAAMSASCAFMLPVATAPNAVIFSSGRVPIQTMIRTGLALNLFGSVLITLVCYSYFQL